MGHRAKCFGKRAVQKGGNCLPLTISRTLHGLIFLCTLKICERAKTLLFLEFSSELTSLLPETTADGGYCISWRKEDVALCRPLETKAMLLN